MNILEFEEALKGNAKINNTLIRAYFVSKEAGNDLIDFNYVINDNEISSIVEDMKNANVSEFTISSNFSGLIKTLSEFEKNGCTLIGLININGQRKDYKTCENDIIPALKMKIK